MGADPDAPAIEDDILAAEQDAAARAAFARAAFAQVSAELNIAVGSIIVGHRRRAGKR